MMLQLSCPLRFDRLSLRGKHKYPRPAAAVRTRGCGVDIKAQSWEQSGGDGEGLPLGSDWHQVPL